MYIPNHFAATAADIRDLLEHHGSADLITSTTDGLLATFLPFVFDPAVGEQGALLGHGVLPRFRRGPGVPRGLVDTLRGRWGLWEAGFGRYL